MAEQINFLDINFSRMPFSEAVQLLLSFMQTRNGKRVYFVNANSVVIAAKAPEFQAALGQADLVLADGSGVLWSSALMKRPLTHNLNGTDLIPALCREAGSGGLSVYLLGGKPGIAEEVAEKLTQGCPGLIIAGTQHGYFQADETQEVLNRIKEARPHLLLVAFGSPLQEIWIDQYAAQLDGILCAGVGGLFDFMAERVRRAPSPIRKAGMEWAWRLAMEPRRLWRRYLLGNAIFFGLVADAYINRGKKLPANVQLMADYRNTADMSQLVSEPLQTVEQVEYVAYEQEKAV